MKMSGVYSFFPDENGNLVEYKSPDEIKQQRDAIQIPDNTPLRWFQKQDRLHCQFHYSTSQLVSEFITMKMAMNWNPESPVFISAPTGAGKSYFIINQLLCELVRRYPNEKNLILLLSNRIAANRQYKLQLLSLMNYYSPRVNYKEKMLTYFNPEGIDQLCLDFGVITICTYHQLSNRPILNNHDFKYIICDECHFFTSDALFNLKTHSMLKEIISTGQRAVRVYMSATPEVAFLPIIEAEVESMKSKIDIIQQDITVVKKLGLDYIDLEERKRFKQLHYSFDENNLSMKEEKRRDELKWQCEQSGMPFKDIFELQKKLDAIRLDIHFYYMKRNYDHINKIFSYKEHTDLIKYIASSTGKWVIFVDTQTEGHTLTAMLKQNNIDCIFLSRDEVEAKAVAKEEYDYIIAQETIRKQVLITTSLLDNGLNIKNPLEIQERAKVLNVAINCCEREQFIQMLGRVRDNHSDQINLYIKTWSTNELKTRLKKESEQLILHLILDCATTRQEQINIFNSHSQKSLFFLYKDDNEIAVSYNRCAIYHLLDQISYLLSFIRRTEPEYVISLSDNLELKKEQLYRYYLDKSGGWDCIWSRTFIDLFESPIKRQHREQYIRYDMENRLDFHRYDYTVDATFTKHWFREILTGNLFYFVQDKYNAFLNRLDKVADRNYFDAMVKIHCYPKSADESDLPYSERTLLLYKQTLLLKRLFPDTFIDISPNFIKDYADKIAHYEGLFDDSPDHSFIDEQLSWLELDSSRLSSGDLPLENNSDTLLAITSPNIEDMEAFIVNHAVSETELHQYITGKNEKYVLQSFLKLKGILKDSAESKMISDTYFNGQPITEHVNKFTRTIDGSEYTLISRNSNASGHKTYYLFLQKTL